MSISKSPQAYNDCYEAMDRAVASKFGIRMLMPNPDKAYYFRMRCHNARAITRRQNTKVYDEVHPMYNASPHDCLQLRIEYDRTAGKTYLYFDKNEVLPGPIEDLEEIHARRPITVEYTEVRQIEGPRDEIAPELGDVVQSIKRRI